MVDTLFIPTVIFLCNWFCYGLPLVMTCISMDALFMSGQFFLSCVIGQSKKETVKTQNMYELSTINRYIWYAICGFIYQILVVSFWIHRTWLVGAAICTVNIPYVQNWLAKNPLDRLFEEINDKKRNFVKKNIAKQFTKIANFVIRTYTDRTDDVVKTRNIRYLLNNYDETMSWFKMILQNVAVIYLLNLMKSYGNRYHFMVKRVYNYYYQDSKVTTTTEEDLKIILNDICDNKDWNKFLDPAFVKLLLHIYYNAELDQENNILLFVQTQITYSFAKFSAIWTVPSVVIPYGYSLAKSAFSNALDFDNVTFYSTTRDNGFHMQCHDGDYYSALLESVNITGHWEYIHTFGNLLRTYSAMIVFMAFHVYKFGWRPSRNREYYGKLAGIVLGMCIIYFLGSDFLSCLVAEFFYYITMNPAMVAVYRAMYKGLKKFIIKNRRLSSYRINTIVISSLSMIPIYLFIEGWNYDDYVTIMKLNLFTTMLSIALVYCSLRDVWTVVPIVIILNVGAQSIFNPAQIIMSVPNIFILMNYLYSEMFMNHIYTVSYAGNYRIANIIKSMNQYVPEYDLCSSSFGVENENDTTKQVQMEMDMGESSDEEKAESVIINNDHNPILIENFFIK